MSRKYINKYPVYLWQSYDSPESKTEIVDDINRTIPENSTWFLKAISNQEILFKIKGENCLRGITVEMFNFAFVEVDEEQDQ